MADVKAKASKVERLENEYTRRLSHQRDAAQHTQVLGRRRRRRATRIIAVFVIFAAILGIQLVRTNASLHHVNSQVATSEQHLTRTKAESRKLKLQVKQLNNDDYVGQLIRSKYYYSKSGETIYSLPGDHAGDVIAK